MAHNSAACHQLTTSGNDDSCKCSLLYSDHPQRYCNMTSCYIAVTVQFLHSALPTFIHWHISWLVCPMSHRHLRIYMAETVVVSSSTIQAKKAGLGRSHSYLRLAGWLEAHINNVNIPASFAQSQGMLDGTLFKAWLTHKDSDLARPHAK